MPGWAAIAVAAAVLVLACALPAVHLTIEAFIGAGAAQRSFRYARDLSFVGDLRPLGLVPLVAGLLLLAAAALAIVRGSSTWFQCSGHSRSRSASAGSRSRRASASAREAHAVSDYKGVHGILQTGIHDLRAEARRSPEAKAAGWTLASQESVAAAENDYSADGLVGWTLLADATLVLLWLTAYRVARLRFGVRASIVAVAAATAATTVWLVLRGLEPVRVDLTPPPAADWNVRTVGSVLARRICSKGYDASFLPPPWS